MRKHLCLCSLSVVFFFLSLSTAFADSNLTRRADVQAFIKEMVKKHHFVERQLNALFCHVQLRQAVLTSASKPLEKRPWHFYQQLFVSDWRIKHGVEFWNKYADVLKRAEREYGVPASIIVATIGIETKYGERIGDFRVIDSLSSFAFSASPRAKFFRHELEEFLLLVREQRLNPLKIMGSYAGAIGQPQFMPSSYRNYAVNFSKSGRTDLIHNEVDVIGSIANYYKKHGWTPKDRVATRALIIGNRYDYLSRKNKIAQPISVLELTRYGVVPKKNITDDNVKVKVIELENRYSKEYWLGFHNFDVIKRYNASDLYAMAVYQLSNHINEQWNREKNG